MACLHTRLQLLTEKGWPYDTCTTEGRVRHAAVRVHMAQLQPVWGRDVPVLTPRRDPYGDRRRCVAEHQATVGVVARLPAGQHVFLQGYAGRAPGGHGHGHVAADHVADHRAQVAYDDVGVPGGARGRAQGRVEGLGVRGSSTVVWRYVAAKYNRHTNA